jgi:hypothetical protein
MIFAETFATAAGAEAITFVRAGAAIVAEPKNY